MTDHDDRSLLSGYLDGELDAEQRAAVDAQLAESAEWRAELDAVRTARDAVRGLVAREPRAGFWDDVTAAVRADSLVDDGQGPVPDADEDASADAAGVVPLAPRRTERTRRQKVVAWAAGGTAVAAALVAVFMIPGRQQVRPNVTAVATQHGATSAAVGDPISGLVPLGPLRGPR